MNLNMKDSIKKRIVGTSLALLLLSIAAPSAMAETRGDLWSNPIFKQGAIGAAVGAGAGVLSDRTSVGRGAVAGGLAGAGTGAVSQSRYFGNKPLLRNTAKGAIIGTGASYATGSDKLKGAVLGAGAGAGYHYIRKYLDDRN